VFRQTSNSITLANMSQAMRSKLEQLQEIYLQDVRPTPLTSSKKLSPCRHSVLIDIHREQ